MRSETTLALAAAFALLAASPAAANDGRRYVVTSTEQTGYDPPVAASSAKLFSDGASRPGFSEPSASDTSTGFGIGAGFGLLFLIIGVIGIVAGISRRLSRDTSAPSKTDGGSYRAAIGDEPFEARVAARLAELHNGCGAVEPMAYDPGAAPVARGFGRKGA